MSDSNQHCDKYVVPEDCRVVQEEIDSKSKTTFLPATRVEFAHDERPFQVDPKMTNQVVEPTKRASSNTTLPELCSKKMCVGKLSDDADRNIPDADRNIPEADKNIPEADRNIPDADRNIPDADRNIPEADKNIPKADRNIPDADRNIPDADRNIPDADRKIPEADRNVADIVKSNDHHDVNSEDEDDGHICGHSNYDPDVNICVKCCLAKYPGTDSGSELDVETYDDHRTSLTVMRYRKEFDLDEDSDDEGDDVNGVNDVFSWSEDRSVFIGKQETFNETVGSTVSHKSPYDLFCQIWDRNTMGKIVTFTNRYAQELLERGERFSWVETDVDELYVYFGLLVLKSLVFMHNLEDHWEGGVCEIPLFGNSMSVDRFISITKSLHFVDNKCIQPNVRGAELKLAKIQPLIDRCNEMFSVMYRPGKFLRVTDTVLNWQDEYSNYERKPRFNMKAYELCDARTGYVSKLVIYNKKGSDLKVPKHGFVGSSKVILELVTELLGKGHCLMLSDFYCGLSMIRHLKTCKTDVAGSMCSSNNLPPAIKRYKKDKSRKDVMCHYTSDVCLINWKVSTHVANVFTTYRPDQIDSNCSNADLLNAIKTPLEQNNFGEDLRTSIGDFKLERLTLKWYTKIFLRLLNISILNVWILYNVNCGAQTSQSRFRRRLLKEVLSRHKECADFLNCNNDSSEEDSSEVSSSCSGSDPMLDADMLIHPMSCSDSDSED